MKAIVLMNCFGRQLPNHYSLDGYWVRLLKETRRQTWSAFFGCDFTALNDCFPLNFHRNRVIIEYVCQCDQILLSQVIWLKKFPNLRLVKIITNNWVESQWPERALSDLEFVPPHRYWLRWSNPGLAIELVLSTRSHRIIPDFVKEWFLVTYSMPKLVYSKII